MKTLHVLFLAALVVACGGDKGDPAVPELGMDYLDEMLDIMQDHALYKKTIDWPNMRSQVLNKANTDGAKTIEDVYPAIEFALSFLVETGSRYFATNSTVITAPRDECTGSSATVDINDSNIGYVPVTRIEDAQAAQAAVDLQAVIKNQDSENIKGWIVDLRGNTGGNMMAMLAGIGPLLGNGVTGYFINSDDTEFQVSYDDGTMLNSGATLNYVADFYTLIKPAQKIAVLIDQRTASSGEGTAIAFMGRSNARLFGSTTCGRAFGPTQFIMSDGALLSLIDAVMADRNKTKMSVGVYPDEAVSGDKEVVDKAIEWINEK